MKAKFEKAFLKGIKKHAAIKKQIEQKVRQIMEHPVEFGEPLKGNLRGFYSCPVKRNFIIIYLYCETCRKKGNAEFVACSDCSDTPDETIKFVDKAITILNCFSNEEPVLGVGEISEITGFTPSTVSRLLSTLESRGVTERAEGYGKYQLGYRIYLWGIFSQKRNNLATIAKPVMEKLRDKCGEEVSLYILADNKRVCLERIPSNHAIAMVGSVGGVFPLHAGASGRILLAFLPEEKRKDIIENSPLERFTPHTVTDPVKLEESFKEIRAKGYGLSKEEREPGAYSVVAPVRDAGNQVTASLSIAGPLYRLSEEQLNLNIKSVLEAAKELSKKIGHIDKDEK